MLNIKKVIFFLVVGVFLVGLTNVVFANADLDGFHANITGISKASKTITTSLSDFYKLNLTTKDNSTETNTNTFGSPSVAYLRNTSTGGINGWIINITIFQFNLSESVNNITRVNISLPAGLNAIYNATGVSSINYCTGNKSDVAGLNCTVYGSGRDIVWIFDSATAGAIITNGTLGQNNSRMSSGVGNATFTINVTSLPSSDGLVDIKIHLSNDSAGTYASVGGSSIEREVNITGKLYLDRTAPTFNSAKTNDTTHLNLTFSENINASTIKIQSLNVTYQNRTGSIAIGVAVSAVETVNSNAGTANDTQFTLTINRIEANETPTVILNMSSVTAITDLAGYAIAANTSVTASDGTPPTFKSGAIDLSVSGTFNVNLTLDWDEPMANITDKIITVNQLLLQANNTQSNVSVQNPLVTAIGGNGTMMYITLNFTDQSNVTRWRTGINLTVNPNYFNDTSGNYMTSRIDRMLLTFTNDTRRPSIINYSYTHMADGNSVLLLGFNESIDIPSVTQAQIRLCYNSDCSGANLLAAANLSDASFNKGHVVANSVANVQTGNKFYNTLNLTLTSNYTNLIAAWDRKGLSTLYLTFENTSMYDLAGNIVNEILNLSGQSITWNQDSTVPTVLSASISDVNVTGPGVHRITVQFSENMTNSTFTITTLPNLIEEDSTAIHTSSAKVFNVTLLEGTPIWEGYYNFTSASTNGEWNITVSTSSTDLSGNAVTNESTNLRFSYDSEPPYIIYAYYINNGTGDAQNAYNGTLTSGSAGKPAYNGDTLVLVFNEPLQPIASANISVGNLTFRDGSFGGGNYSIIVEDNKVRIMTNQTPTLSLRGEWVDIVNATAIQNITNRNLNANSSSWFIRDKADNFATNKSAKSTTVTAQTGPKTVIADYAVEVEPNQPITISFPTCVNTGNLSNYLPSSTSARTFAKYYNTATWGEHAVTALVPLVGYRFTFNNASVSKLFTYSHSQWGSLSDNMLRIYLANQSDCSLESNEITVDDGWNFLALNGNYYSSTKNTGGRLSDTPDNWLASLSSDGTTGNIQVGSIVPGFGNTTSYSNAGRLSDKNWDSLIVKPYEGLWVQSTAANTFTGTARW